MQNKKLFFTIIFLFCLFSATYAADEIIVQATQYKGEVYDYNFDAEQIMLEKPESIVDVINNLSAFNVIRSGFSLVHSDLFSNAGTFEEVSIIVDGIKVNDLQTGHYNLDLPFSILDVNHISVRDGATTGYGDGGSTGLIDIKTKSYSKDTVTLIGSYGTYDTYYSSINAAKRIDDLTASGTFEKSASSGYHYDTDYNIENAYFKLNYKDDFIADIGYDGKDYGAYDFYTPGLNLASREHTDTNYADLKLFNRQDITIDSYFRAHYDKFTLDENDPEDTNRHNEAEYGAIARYIYTINPDDALVFKYNLQREEIQSSVLGDHYRDKNLLLMNGIFNFDEQLLINANLNLEKYDVYQNYDFLPEINLAYTFNELLKISAGSSYTVRYPNFTELYYEDEYDLGNPELKPERSYEERLGFEGRLGILTMKNSLFYRFNFDAIDWAAGMVTYTDGITRNGWLVENIGKINTAGDTVGVLADFGNMKFSTDFTYLDSYESVRYQSKYGITYLKDKLVTAASFNVFGTDIKLDYTYKKYINRSDLYNNFDCILAKKILDWLEISLKVEDIFNAYYEEVIGIPAMGRMITLRVDINY